MTTPLVKLQEPPPPLIKNVLLQLYDGLWRFPKVLIYIVSQLSHFLTYPPFNNLNKKTAPTEMGSAEGVELCCGCCVRGINHLHPLQLPDLLWQR